MGIIEDAFWIVMAIVSIVIFVALIASCFPVKSRPGRRRVR